MPLPNEGEMVLDLVNGGSFVSRATDPVVSYTPPLTPIDFVGQFPQPLPTTELVAMCEEVTFLKYLPEVTTMLKFDTWRELNELAFLSGSTAISFADGSCPEEYAHDGDNTTLTKKNIGARKTLGWSDILHSMGSIAAGVGINSLVGPTPAGLNMPGAGQATTFVREAVASLKEKEILLGSTLVMNGWDNLLLNGSVVSNSLAFDGLTVQVTGANGAHTNSTGASGTISAASFDRWLSEGCAKPTLLVCHPQVAQELLSAYFQLGFAGAQVIQYSAGQGGATGITPGYNFAGFVNTGIGRLEILADTNIGRTAAGGGNFQSKIYGLRMTHNGEQLVYKCTQIPFSYYDLVPGCTAISFMLWAKTALTVKHMCAHGVYTALFTGNIVTTCPVIL